MNKSNFIQGFFATVEVHTNKVNLDEFYTRFFAIIFTTFLRIFYKTIKCKINLNVKIIVK